MTSFNPHPFEVTIDGVLIHAAVSPCSWMNKNYGMQVSLALKKNAPNIGCHFILNKNILAADATQADVDKMIIDFISAGGMKDLVKAEEARVKFMAETAEWMEQDRKQQEALIAKRRKTAKERGYNFEVTAWVHPSSGDDYAIVINSATKMTDAEIVKVLKSKRSEVLNDFVQVEI